MNYDEREDRAFCLDCHQDCCNSEEAGMQVGGCRGAGWQAVRAGWLQVRV